MFFHKVTFNISRHQSLYLDEKILEDKKKEDCEREYRGGKSEYIRKLINKDMKQAPIA